MRLILFIFLYIILHNCYIYAQDKVTHAENLFAHIFKEYSKDSLRIKMLLDTANRISQTNPDTAIKIFRKALSLAQKNKYKKYQAGIETGIGIIYRSLGYRDSAVTHYIKAEQIFQELKHYEGMAVTYVNLANLYNEQEDWEKSTNYYKKAQIIFEKTQNKHGLGTVYLNIGSTYYNNKKWDSCEMYYLKSEQELKSFKEYANSQLVLANLSRLYLTTKKYQKAKSYAQKAIDFNPNNLKHVVSSSLTLAEVFLYENNLENAHYYAKNALDNAQKIKDTQVQPEAHLILSKVYHAKKEYDKAISHLNTVITLKDSLFKFTLKTQQENVLKKLDHLNYKIQITEATRKAAEQRKTILLQRIILLLCMAFLAITAMLLFLFYKRNQLIKQAYYSIELKNAVLEQQKQTIQELNHNLETMVSERTQKLEDRNKKLKEYADYNAHILRAPLARILGLFEVYKEAKSIEEKEQIFTYLHQTVNELDIIVKDIQHKLQDKNT